MAACTSCHKGVPEACERCPYCGKALSLAFDISGAGELDLSLAPVTPPPVTKQAAASPESFAPIPDIELPSAPPPRAKSAEAKAPARASMGSIDVGRGGSRDSITNGVEVQGSSTLPGLFDDDEPLSLELEDAPLKRRASPPKAAVVTTPDSARGAPPAASSTGRRSAPSLRPPPPAAPEAPMEADDREARRLGGYGPSPQYLWESPVYAWRVQERLRALRAELIETKKAVLEAEEQRDAQLLEVIERYRRALEADGQASRILASYKEPLEELRKQSRMLSETLNRRAESSSRHDDEIASLERVVSQLRATIEEKKQGAAALYASSKTSGGAAQQAFEQGRKDLAEAEQREQETLARITELRRRRKTVEQESLTMQAEIEQDLEKARLALKEPLRELGPGLFALDLQLPHGAWGQLMATKKAADDLRARVALLERAQGAFDGRKVKEGVGAVVGAIALIVLLIAMGVIRMEPPELAPASSPPSSEQR